MEKYTEQKFKGQNWSAGKRQNKEVLTDKYLDERRRQKSDI